VSQAPLTITADNATRGYGQTNPVFTGTITGLQNADPITASYSTAATAASPVGVYAISATLLDPYSNLGNYTVTTCNGSMTVTPAGVAIVSGITANNKVYDGTTTATIRSNNVVLTGVVQGDTVSLVTNGYVATFAGAGVGAAIAVTVNGLSLSGASAGNYTFAQPAGLTANIAPAAVLKVKANKTAQGYTQNITPVAGTFALTWSAVAGQPYQLQYKTNLSQTVWTNLGAVITATDATVTVSDDGLSDPQRFYRLVVLP
jgi:hypothetical protein